MSAELQTRKRNKKKKKNGENSALQYFTPGLSEKILATRRPFPAPMRGFGLTERCCRQLLQSVRGTAQPTRDCCRLLYSGGKQRYPAEILVRNRTSPTATDPPVAGSVCLSFLLRKFEWQTSGDNGKQQALIDTAAEIRPALFQVLPHVMGGRGGGLFTCATNSSLLRNLIEQARIIKKKTEKKMENKKKIFHS